MSKTAAKLLSGDGSIYYSNKASDKRPSGIPDGDYINLSGGWAVNGAGGIISLASVKIGDEYKYLSLGEYFKRYFNAYSDNWEDIVCIAEGKDHITGLRGDGTVAFAGSNYYGQCNVNGWKNIVKIWADNNHTIGLKSDGSIIFTGEHYNDYHEISAATGWDGEAPAIYGNALFLP